MPERIATIDNDGTLWIEQPIYTQFAFAVDEVKRQANKHPEWSTTEPFKSVIAGDMKAVVAMGEKGMIQIVAATHSGMTTVDFNKTVARDYGALMEDNGMALRATFIIDPNGIVQHASYNADLLGRSVSETLRLVQALQTGERCPVEWKPGAKTLGKPA